MSGYAHHRSDFIAWIGHASFLIRINGEYWITDPIFSERALLPKRKTPPGLSLSEFAALPGKKNVLISHSHYDHLDSESIRRLPADTRVYVPLGLKALMNDLGKEDVVEMDWWQAVSCGDHCQVVCLPAQHWSRRITQNTDTTLWASFLLVTPGRKIYYGGDSGYFIGYREIGRRYPGIDYALLPVTAYEPRWFMHYAHMDAREALDAFRDLGARYFIPTQWGTFRLGDEPIGQAPSALSKAANPPTPIRPGSSHGHRPAFAYRDSRTKVQKMRKGDTHRSATLIRDPSFNPFGGFMTTRSPALSPDRISTISPNVFPTRTGVSRTRFPSRRYANVLPFRSIRADRLAARRGFISSGASLRWRKETLALMSGSIRRSLSRKRTLTRTVALLRSTVGTMA